MSRTPHRLMELALRKERLVARAEAQRAAVGERFRELQRPIAIADAALSVVRTLRAHPALVAVGVAVLVALRGRGLFSIAGRLYSVWRLWRTVSAWTSGRPV